MSDLLRDTDPPLPSDHPFVRGLAPNAANHVPLSPVTFLERSASIWPDKIAVRHGEVACTYREFEARCRRLASALARRGIRRGDTVAVHRAERAGVARGALCGPGAGRDPERAQLCGRTRRRSRSASAMARRRSCITDGEFAPVVKAALAQVNRELLVIDIADPQGPAGERLGSLTYEALLAEGDPAFAWPGRA